mgnify:CR=1 FL=1
MGQLLLVLLVTSAMVGGAIYFVQEIWSTLPAWLSLILFIIIAIAIIGYPIYSLARWSDRRFAQYQQTDKAKKAMRRDNNDNYDKDDDW